MTNKIAILARATITRLRQYDVDLPTEITAALAQLDALEALAPAKPQGATWTEDVAAAYLAGDPDAAAQAAITASINARMQDGYETAERTVAGALRSAITSNSQNLVEQLKERAQPLIEALEQGAALDTTDVAVLTRQKRTKEARVAASLEIVHGELVALYSLRNNLTEGAQYGTHGWDASTWRDERKVRSLSADATPVDHILDGIRRGAGLWFPSPDEAVAAAKAIVADRIREDAANRDRARRRGAFV